MEKIDPFEPLPFRGRALLLTVLLLPIGCVRLVLFLGTMGLLLGLNRVIAMLVEG
jgi:hypothetical protein